MLKNSAHKGLTGAAVRELASEARTGLRLEKGGYRRDHVRAFAQHVEVADDAIYINGSKSTLLRALIATKGGKSAGIGVPGFIPRWRMGWDSNPRYPFEVYTLSRRAPSTARPPIQRRAGGIAAFVRPARGKSTGSNWTGVFPQPPSPYGGHLRTLPGGGTKRYALNAGTTRDFFGLKPPIFLAARAAVPHMRRR